MRTRGRPLGNDLPINRAACSDRCSNMYFSTFVSETRHVMHVIQVRQICFNIQHISADSPNSDLSSARRSLSPVAVAFAMKYHLAVPASMSVHVLEQHLKYDAHADPCNLMNTACFADAWQRFAWCSAHRARWSESMQCTTPISGRLVNKKVK